MTMDIQTKEPAMPLRPGRLRGQSFVRTGTVLLSLLGLLLAACSDSASGELLSIELTPIAPSVLKRATIQLTATGRYGDQSTRDLSGQVSWSSADSSVAAVDHGGLVAAAAIGTAEITASLNGLSGKTTITVTMAPVIALAVTSPASSVAKGNSLNFVAMGTLNDFSTQDLTTQVSWASSDMAIATVDSNGVGTGRGLGTATISATLGNQSGSSLLTVTAPLLASIKVTPATPSIARATSQQFLATGTYTDGSTQDLTAMVTWFSASGLIANISNAAGSQGLATGVGTGMVTIAATFNGKQGSTILTVT